MYELGLDKEDVQIKRYMYSKKKPRLQNIPFMGSILEANLEDT